MDSQGEPLTSMRMTMTTTPDKMVEAFDRFKGQIDEAYAAARHFLEQGDYPGAQAVLARIAQVHAKTSLSLRTYCMKHGLLPGEE